MATVNFDASDKFQNTLLHDFHQKLMRAYKITVGSGFPQELMQLYSTMYHEWSTLQKDVTDVMEAVSSLDWSVVPYAGQGQEPTPQAVDIADTVTEAIWRASEPQPGTFAHNFTETVGAMLDGIFRGLSVHEIIWAHEGNLIYPAEYRQVPPQFYIWETREGHTDRLLLIPDGRNYADPVPFPPGKFIVAMNTVGSDHPIYNATFYSLLSYFMAAKFGLPWMQDYCLRYGHPLRVFHVQNERDAKKLQEQIKAAPDIHDIFLQPERSVEITPIPAASGNPHEILLRIAENACHQAILGQTLTSDTSQSGGSLAQAKVHLGVQKNVVMQRAEYVARVLNRQLIPAIVRANYGQAAARQAMPELTFSFPDETQNIARAEYWGKVLQIPGMRVPANIVYESLRIPHPKDGDETLATPTQGTQNAQDALQSADAPAQAQDTALPEKGGAEAVLSSSPDDRRVSSPDEQPDEYPDAPRRRPSLLNREELASTLHTLFRSEILRTDDEQDTQS